MQRLIDFYQNIEAEIRRKIKGMGAGITASAAAYTCKMSRSGARVYKILNDLMAFRTDGSFIDYDRCIKYIEKYVKEANPQSIIKHIPTNGKDNLIIGLNVEKLQDISSGLMLCGHLDVVGGQTEQFDPQIDDNKIYGRGATDMKGSIACCLEAIPCFNALELPVILCFTCDEETDMQGIRDVCAFLKRSNIHPQLTILGEPTKNKLGICSSGIESFKTSVYGVPAHSSVAHKGINAVFVAAEILQQLETIAQKMHCEKLCLNVGGISGGGNIAVVPDRAEIDWGLRHISAKSAEKTKELYDKAVAATLKKYPQARIETIKTAEFPGYAATDSKQTKYLCEKLQIATAKPLYTSEAGYLAENGQNVYLLGCGNIEQAHSDDEYITTDDLKVYGALLRKTAEIVKNNNKKIF